MNVKVMMSIDFDGYESEEEFIAAIPETIESSLDGVAASGKVYSVDKVSSYLDSRDIVYVLEMNRWGDEEQHHYCVGIYTSLRQALLDGIDHSEYRGGKYDPFITMMEVNKNSVHNHICKNVEEARILLREWEEDQEVTG